jgi:hypothetical protein
MSRAGCKEQARRDCGDLRENSVYRLAARLQGFRERKMAGLQKQKKTRP